MSGRRKWSDIRDQQFSTPEAQAKLVRAQESLERELVNHSRTLKQLRRARRMTQSQVAAQMRVSQAQVSRVEGQADLYLSTLRSYVQAMGGELQLRVSFAGGDWSEVTVGEITGFEDEPSNSSEQIQQTAPQLASQYPGIRAIYSPTVDVGATSGLLWLFGASDVPGSPTRAGIGEAHWWPSASQRPTAAPGTAVVSAYLGEVPAFGVSQVTHEGGALKWLSLSGDLKIPDDSDTFISEASVREG